MYLLIYMSHYIPVLELLSVVGLMVNILQQLLVSEGVK